jgi:predicted RNA-binding Zn-ribbon protein involved in translation (DUF1610 family)
MSLYKCPECGHMISSDADSCPNCGWKTANARRGETGRAMQSCGLMMTLFITVPIVLICIFMGM